MPAYSFEKIQEFRGHTSAVYSMVAGHLPGHVLSCGSEGVVANWNIATGEATAVAKAPGPIFSMCLIPERNLLLMGLENGDLIFADLIQKQTLRRVQLHKKAIFDFLPLPDGIHVLASGGDGAISIWNLDKLDHLHFEKVAEKSIRTMALAPDGKTFVCGSSDQYLRRFDLGLQLQQSWKAHQLSIFRVAYSPDGKSLFSTGRDAHLTRWDVQNNYSKSQSVPAHTGSVNDILFMGDTPRCLTGSMDKSIKLWDSEDLKLLKVCNFDKNQCHWNGVNRLLWHENHLFSCSDDRKIMQWQLQAMA